MRLLLGCGLLLVLFASTGVAADDKIDAKKLIGKWDAADKKEKMVIEFTADAKFAVTGDAAVSGAWKLDNNKLMLTFKFGENEDKDTVTITKLTDDELLIEDAKKEKKRSFKRVK